MFTKIWLRAAGALLAVTTAGVGGVVAATGANAWSTAVWDKVAYCESTNRWDINTGNGYYGGLQFSHSTWIAYGGGDYGTNANQATKAQQIAIARRVLAGQGPGAWPVCSGYAGLTKTNGGADSQAMPVGEELAVTTNDDDEGDDDTTSSVSVSQNPNGKIDVDGVLGPLTIAEMQRWSGSTPDGIWGSATSTALQRKVGAEVTGVRDAQTTRKVQGVVGASVDGVWGPRTTSHLQLYLNAR